tara:strand:+ start:335 stop:610 length:276 start_codon:yes stop_codon:yes gene_type:complete
LTRQPKDKRDGIKKIELNLPQYILSSTGYKEALNSRWVEVLMGLPVFWCAPLSLENSCHYVNRTDEFRLLGNGVVPQTAERAFLVLAEKVL